MTSRIEIRLLGELTVLRGGESIPLPPSKKARALLGPLIAVPGPHLRERLCDLLWDGPVDPRGELRWALSRLRPLVNDDAVRQMHGNWGATATCIDPGHRLW